MLNKALRFIHFIEDSLLVTLIMSLLLLSCTQIVFRNLGVSGIMWSDNATRIIVLWLALFGAMRASRLRNHISIDLMTHYSSATVKKLLNFITCIFSAAVCGIASYYCYLFIQLEMEDRSIAFLIIPTWLCEAIIPFALAVMALRFILQSLTTDVHDDYIS